MPELIQAAFAVADDNPQQEFLDFRDSVMAAQLATQSPQGKPFASHAPLVWSGNACYLFLSELAEHTQHLLQNPSIGLVMLKSEPVRNHFATPRITLQGEAQMVERESEQFKRVITDFHQKFGQVMQLIEPLSDFHLFRVDILSGRYIRGFGQAFSIEGSEFDRLIHINPGK